MTFYITDISKFDKLVSCYAGTNNRSIIPLWLGDNCIKSVTTIASAIRIRLPHVLSVFIPGPCAALKLSVCDRQTEKTFRLTLPINYGSPICRMLKYSSHNMEKCVYLMDDAYGDAMVYFHKGVPVQSLNGTAQHNGTRLLVRLITHSCIIPIALNVWRKWIVEYHAFLWSIFLELNRQMQLRVEYITLV